MRELGGSNGMNGPAPGPTEMQNPPALIGGAVVPLGGADTHYFSLCPLSMLY